MSGPTVSVCFIVKNEEDNISRALDVLSGSGLSVFVFDSGSTDKTLEISGLYDNLSIISRPYLSHCETYNYIICTSSFDYVIILDGDTIIDLESIGDLAKKMQLFFLDSMISPVDFYVESVRLKHGSLYPPKPFMFRTGRPLFERVGHSERLINDAKSMVTQHSVLSHDDRKPFVRFLDSQVRYHKKIEESIASGVYTWRDWLRVKTPLFGLISFFYIYFIRLGFLSGRAGMIYAVDRLIAESIIYRQSLSNKIKMDLK